MLLVTFQAPNFTTSLKASIGTGDLPESTLYIRADGHYAAHLPDEDRSQQDLEPVSGIATLRVWFKNWQTPIHSRKSVGAMHVMLTKEENDGVIFMEIDAYFPWMAHDLVLRELNEADGENSFLTFVGAAIGPDVATSDRTKALYGDSFYAMTEVGVEKAEFYDVSLFKSAQRLSQVCFRETPE